jgi:hypothetical protein
VNAALAEPNTPAYKFPNKLSFWSKGFA